MALIVAQALADLAHRTNVTVICSIHQPSSQVFLSFDQLLLLDGGHVAYNGVAREAATHFAAVRDARLCWLAVWWVWGVTCVMDMG